MYSQNDCESGEGEKFAYEQLTTLCETYGNQTPTITTTDGFSSDFTSGDWNNEVVYLSGQFIINTANFDITNSIVQMAPGAGITVDVGNSLAIDDSYIFSCDTMWRSINALTDSNLRIRDSEIEDAQYAIDASGADLVSVHRSVFQSNWVAARLRQKPADPSAIHRFTGDDFIGSTLLPPYIGQAPIPGSESFAGIWADTIPLVILGNAGSNTVASNRFITLKTGVISERSEFMIQRTSFESMIDEGTLFGFQSGVGILALENSLIEHSGFGKNGLTAFVGCQYASIFSEESSCKTRDAKHSRLGKFGVRAITPKDHYTRIRNSSFDNTNLGIFTTSAAYVERSTTNDDEIIDNYVYSVVPSAASLMVFNDMGAGSGTASVLRDTIEGVFQQISGMEIRPGSGTDLLVADNIITAEQLFIGLQVNFSNSASSNITVTRNRIESLQSATQLAKLNEAKNVLFCNNTMLGNNVASVGLIVLANASGTTLGLNTIEETEYGLIFQGSGINMGTQIHKGNRWDNGFGTWAAIHTASDFLLSQFRVNDDPANCGDPDYFPNDLGIASVSPTNGWFINVLNGDCIDDCSQPQANLVLGDVFEKTVNGEGLALGWTAAAEWAAQAYLYEQLANGAETGLSASLRSEFEHQLSETNIPRIQAYQTRIQEALGGDAAARANARAQFAAREESFANYVAYLESLPDMDEADPNSAASQAWADSYTTFDDFLAERSATRRTELEQLLGDFTLSNPSFIEEQWLLATRLLLEKELNGELVPADWTALEELASQCYDTHGSAVYLAQGMLPPCRWEELRSRSEAACEPQERPVLPLATIQEKSNGLLLLYPNPGSGQVQLKFLEELQAQDIIVVKNIYGQEVLRQAASLPNIDTVPFYSGIYYVEYWRDDVLLSTIKFVRS
jgi:hypothetical protein